jgi:hypothetical protein
MALASIDITSNHHVLRDFFALRIAVVVKDLSKLHGTWLPQMVDLPTDSIAFLDLLDFLNKSQQNMHALPTSS